VSWAGDDDRAGRVSQRPVDAVEVARVELRDRGRGVGREVAKPADRAQRRSTAPARRPREPRGRNKTRVLEALKGGSMTVSEIAKATGIGTGSVSTLLTKLSKSGELVQAERGYRLPD
jgi:predicted Rossmann fold nucleotide-binding protein DprA/Smf involved in DNA uptake